MMNAMRMRAEPGAYAPLPAGPGAAGPRDGDRNLYWRIGAFLFDHGLPAAPDYYALAHIYLLGLDPGVVAAIDGAIGDDGTLPRAVADALIRRAGIGPLPAAELFERVAQETSARFDRVAGLVGRSHADARSFGDALAADLAHAPIDMPTAAALLDLARAMLASTRYAEERLRRTAQEMDELRVKLDAARIDADTDPLTGLANRRAFDRIFCEERDRVAERGGLLSVALIDIDRFKAVNDVHGHDVGDRVLRHVGRALRQACAPHIVARRGGEEFALMFAGLGPAAAFTLVDGARAQIAGRTVRVSETRLALDPLTFSGGIAAFDGAESCETVLHRADMLLYAAKQAGRNRLLVQAPA